MFFKTNTYREAEYRVSPLSTTPEACRGKSGRGSRPWRGYDYSAKDGVWTRDLLVTGTQAWATPRPLPNIHQGALLLGSTHMRHVGLCLWRLHKLSCLNNLKVPISSGRFPLAPRHVHTVSCAPPAARYVTKPFSWLCFLAQQNRNLSPSVVKDLYGLRN